MKEQNRETYIKYFVKTKNWRDLGLLMRSEFMEPGLKPSLSETATAELRDFKERYSIRDDE